MNNKELRKPNFLAGGLIKNSNLIIGAQNPNTLLKIAARTLISARVFLKFPELSVG
jgi:hypothetical protein